MPSADRATRLGTIIVVVAIAAIFLAGTGAYVLVRYAPGGRSSGYNPIVMAAASARANAQVLIWRPFQKRFAASAVLDLPPVPPQDDSPSLQITFYQRNATVQGGVIRTPHDHFRMTAFLEYSNPSTPLGKIRYFGFLADRPHVVAIAGDTQTIDFTVDGKVLDRMPRDEYLPIHGRASPWAMLGTAVAKPGNAASGTISHITIRSENDAAMVAIIPRCVVTRGGIEIKREGSAWVLGGRYTPGVRARYDHCTRKDMS